MLKAASKKRARELRAIVGDPEQVVHDLERLRDSASSLSSDNPRFIDEFPEKWVAVYGDNQVIARESLGELLAAMDEHGVSRQRSIVRFIDRNARTLFL